jgi:hypothetical protein
VVVADERVDSDKGFIIIRSHDSDEKRQQNRKGNEWFAHDDSFRGSLGNGRKALASRDSLPVKLKLLQGHRKPLPLSTRGRGGGFVDDPARSAAAAVRQFNPTGSLPKREPTKSCYALVSPIRTFFPQFPSPVSVHKVSQAGAEQARIELQVVILE